MELILIFASSVIFGGGGILYLSDRKGFHGTAKRLSTLIRASVEGSKVVKALEAKVEDKQSAEWDAEFYGDEAGRLSDEAVGINTGRSKPLGKIVTWDEYNKLTAAMVKDSIERVEINTNGVGGGNYTGQPLNAGGPRLREETTSERWAREAWEKAVENSGLSKREVRAREKEAERLAQEEAAEKAKAAAEKAEQERIKKLRHWIVKFDYVRSYNGAWPRWVCKCGASDKLPTGIYTNTEERVKAQGWEHVRRMNDAEEKLQSSNGRYAF